MEPLTVDRFRELWSRTYNSEGKPDWSHIFPYYHEDIVFEDSIQRIEGMEAFRALCARLTKRCQQLNMEIQSVATNPNERHSDNPKRSLLNMVWFLKDRGYGKNLLKADTKRGDGKMFGAYVHGALPVGSRLNDRFHAALQTKSDHNGASASSSLR